MGDPYRQQNRPLLGPQAYEEQAWSRLGPMGPLLDPKIYPAKVGAAPESQIARFNQPNVFLAKVYRLIDVLMIEIHRLICSASRKVSIYL